MKKLFLGLAIAASSLTFAQTFGVKAGVNVASLSKDESLDDQKSKIGFNAGAFVNIPLSDKFSIQPELLFSQYGAKAEYSESETVGGVTSTYKGSSKMDLSYITVPVMFQYNLMPNLYVEAGPEFGLNVTAKSKDEESLTLGGTTTSSSETYDYKDDINSFNVGLGLGVGYYFTPNIGVTARYVAGLTDIWKENSGDAVKNNVFQIGVAYKFGKK